MKVKRINVKRVSVVIMLAVLIFGYVTFKTTYVILNNNLFKSNTTLDNYKYKSKIKVEYKEPENKVQFMNVSVRNDFDTYTKYNLENGVIYNLKEEGKSFEIEVSKDKVKLISDNKLIKYLKENNISNTLGLLDHLVYLKDNRSNFFTSISAINIKTELLETMNDNLNTNRKVIAVNDNALYLEMDGISILDVYKNGKVYEFRFINFDTLYVDEFISTISVD